MSQQETAYEPEASGGLTYEVEVLKQRFWSGTLNYKKMADILNRRAADGWRLSRTVTSSSRSLLVFKRESVFLIFERST